MKKNIKSIKKRKHGFTLVELMIVIVIIGILAAIIIQSVTDAIEDAREKAALSDARNAWTEGLWAIKGDYTNFIGYRGVLNGWLYDNIDDVAKFHVDGRYTVTYDGKEFTVKNYDGSLPMIGNNFTIEEMGSGDSIDWNY